MARPKTKESKAITIRLSVDVYERLDKFAQDSGQMKTVAIERAITAYMNSYYQERAIIENLNSKK